MNLSDEVAVASLAIAVAALLVAIYAIARANKTTSAATLVSLNEAFRQAWERLLATSQTDTSAVDAELADLLNLIEIACAIHLEGSVTGHSKRLLVEYLNNVLAVLTKATVFNDRALRLVQTQDTFEFIKRFLEEKRADLSVTIPPKWYELQT